MGMVRGITYYIGPGLRKGVAPARGLMLEDDGALCRTFGKVLLESQLDFQMNIQLPSLAPLICQWGRCGPAAGVAARVHNKTIQGVTAFLSGIDRKDQATAAESLLASKPLLIPLLPLA